MRRIWNFAGTAVWSSRQGRTEPLFYKWLLFECGNQPVPCSDNVCGSPPPFERIYQGIRSGLTIQYSYCAVIWVVIFVMKTPLVGLVLSETTSATATGAVEYLTVMSALFFIHGSLMIMRNTLQGLGYSMQAIISGRIKKPLYIWNERPVNSGFLYCQNF